MSSREPGFEVLDPPPGGLTRLRARLDAEQPRRAGAWVAVPIAAVLVLALAVLWPRPVVAAWPEDAAWIALTRGRTDGGPVRALDGTAIQRVELVGDEVVMYRVAAVGR